MSFSVEKYFKNESPLFLVTLYMDIIILVCMIQIVSIFCQLKNFCVFQINFPYKSLDVNNMFDLQLLQELKETFCHLSLVSDGTFQFLCDFFQINQVDGASRTIFIGLINVMVKKLKT